jgi:DNA replication and repair protein RecF
MRITKLALKDFRSYQNVELHLKPGVNTFIGDNGSGKTNIAESLIYLSFLSSHRVANNQPLISLGATQAIIRAEIEREDRTLQIDLEINVSKANRARINQNPTRSQRRFRFSSWRPWKPPRFSRSVINHPQPTFSWGYR